MKPIIISLVMAVITTGALAEDIDLVHGKQLVDDNCYSCHGDDVYTRKDRRVTSRPGLSKQVQRCELSLGLSWFDEDVENAAEFLNQNFYRFGK